MTLQQLEYILSVDRLRHFGKAAEECHVTQPTLSAMIQKLEEELEIKIFDRSRQPITTTPAGRLVIGQAAQVLSQAASIRELIEEEKRSMTGILRLGMLPTIAPYLLPRFFPQLRLKYPMLEMRVAEMKTADILQALQSGEIDAGIVAALDGMEGMAQRELFYEQFFVYVAAGDPLSARTAIRSTDLSAPGRRLWMLDEGHCLRDQLQRFCHLESARDSQRTYRLGSLETFMRMVEGGEGITFLPHLAVLQLHEEQRRLVRPFALPCPTRRIILITRPDFIRRTLADTLAQEIRQAVPQEMLALKPTQVLV